MTCGRIIESWQLLDLHQDCKWKHRRSGW